MMPSLQVDKGAIGYVLSGANIMCRGLTTPGGRCEGELPVGTPVVRDVGFLRFAACTTDSRSVCCSHFQAIFAEGKVHPLAIGVLKMSTNDM
jgi:malignant T-cell-amplified sequence